MVWEWQVWRSFDDVRETFEEKGWHSGFAEERNDNGTMPPLLAAPGDYCIALFKRDRGTSECWFEVRDMVRSRRVLVHGTHHIPTPERAAELIAGHGGPLYEVADRASYSIYGLPIAPLDGISKAY
jgi:hypothetical protein